MRRIIWLLLVLFTLSPLSAFAILTMELTRGVAGAIPIAVVPFTSRGPLPQDVTSIISNDLQNSGRFKVIEKSLLTGLPSNASDFSTETFRRIGTDNVVVGQVQSLGGDRYQVSFELLDMYRGSGAARAIISKKYAITRDQFRSVAHHISDLVYQQITGIRGIFSTKLAYIVVQREDETHVRYILEVSDQDGFNPRPLLTSPEPIMSPAWSPNGKQIAYVSFENKHAGIYIQEVKSGSRRLLSKFPGINGAPAWSPDGRKLALVLSKTGSPNIYVMDIGSKQINQITNDFYINTEPAWSGDGKSLLFTSNRSGGVQVYQVNLASNAVSRVSYDGDYNARPSFTRDGKNIAMIHRVAGIFNIALLNLDDGTTRVLSSKTQDSASPSIAPNGSMILYDTVYGGRNVLAMVSADGSIQLVLPARNGEAQDPAWSPYLS